MSAHERSETARTRSRILRAAGELAKEQGSTVTVRRVAERAGVALGTLRYHFPTQRELLDAVLATIYEEAMPDDRIRDQTIPPRERLLECLLQFLAPIGVGRQARETWTGIHTSFIDLAVSDEARQGYLELSRQGMRRVESWLSILVEEGAIPPGDNAARARELLTILTGLSVQRALPSEESPLQVERQVLGSAVDRLIEQNRTSAT